RLAELLGLRIEPPERLLAERGRDPNRVGPERHSHGRRRPWNAVGRGHRERVRIDTRERPRRVAELPDRAPAYRELAAVHVRRTLADDLTGGAVEPDDCIQKTGVRERRLPELGHVREYGPRDDDRGERRDAGRASPRGSDTRALAWDRGRGSGDVGRLLPPDQPRGRCPHGDLATRMETELVADLLDVMLGSAFGDGGVPRELTVRQAMGEEVGHLAFAAGKLRCRRLHDVANVILPSPSPSALQRVPSRIVGRRPKSLASHGRRGEGL